MKKSYFFPIFLILLLLGCNKKEILSVKILGSNEIFLLKKEKNIVSVNFYKENIIEIAEFKVSSNSIYATDSKKLIVILDTVKNTILINDIKLNSEIVEKIPFKIKSKSVIVEKNNVFIGGELGNEMLINYNILHNSWHSLTVPTEILSQRKAIDDLIVKDSILIAIDNIVFPKYILFYNLKNEQIIEFIRFEELIANGAYEEIHKGSLSNNCLGVFSSTHSGYIGSSNHIRIYKDLNLNESFSIYSNERDKEFFKINDFLIFENKVIIASENRGLLMFCIEQKLFSKHTVFTNRRDIKINITNTKTLFDLHKNITNITQIPKTNKVVITTKSGLLNKIQNIIIEIPKSCH